MLLEDYGSEYKKEFLETVMVHIDRAEYYYQQAEILKDEQFYTDVLNRTNKAYEGILRFTYREYTMHHCDGFGEIKSTTYELENYFEDLNLYNERLKVAFTLYRKLWRNPSVHENELFFNKDEALFAISHVLTLIFILLNQCAEHHSYNMAKCLEELGISKEEDNGGCFDINKLSEEDIVNCLIGFHEIPKDEINNMSQIIGAFKGYLERVMPGMEVVTHYKGEEVLGFQPDIILNKDDKTIFIIEVKNEFSEEKKDFGYKQLKEYLFRSDLEKGVLYFFTKDSKSSYEVIKESIRDKEIITMKPK